jgi:hypothetical protein
VLPANPIDFDEISRLFPSRLAREAADPAAGGAGSPDGK